jgi:hypothetical protein
MVNISIPAIPSALAEEARFARQRGGSFLINDVKVIDAFCQVKARPFFNKTSFLSQHNSHCQEVRAVVLPHCFRRQATVRGARSCRGAGAATAVTSNIRSWRYVSWCSTAARVLVYFTDTAAGTIAAALGPFRIATTALDSARMHVAITAKSSTIV